MALTRLWTHYLFTFLCHIFTRNSSIAWQLKEIVTMEMFKDKMLFIWDMQAFILLVVTIRLFLCSPFSSCPFCLCQETFTVVFLLYNQFNLMYYPVPLQPQRGTDNKNTNWCRRCINELFEENYLSLTLCLLANCFNYAIKCL